MENEQPRRANYSEESGADIVGVVGGAILLTTLTVGAALWVTKLLEGPYGSGSRGRAPSEKYSTATGR
tara:strand:- start:1730 stop:1933 length:204 start_codon:yes stop_codon:yes gene_type:complete